VKGIIRIIIPLCALTGAVAADEAGRFIPWSPLNASEKAAAKTRLQRVPSVTDEMAERMLADEDSYHTFRDADIFAAYPELRGHERLWLCSNSILSGATEIAFLAERAKNEATIEKLGCRRAKAGIHCGEPTRGQYFFREGSAGYFTLDGLSFATATTLLDAFEAKRISGLPEWAEPRGLTLTAIKALSPGRYRLVFGDGLCSGCFTVFEVRVESSDADERLVVEGQPNAGCF
jgi:hypothetical protein